MSTSLVYRSALLYELAKLCIYRSHYSSHYRELADLIPTGSSVLELCCGPATLYCRHLRAKAVRYTGLDINTQFIRRVNRHGGTGTVWDLRTEAPLPAADCVLIQGSLYHFLPDAKPVVDRMLAAARERVIVSEPIRTPGTSGNPVLASFMRRHSNPGTGAHRLRFTETMLAELFRHYASRLERSFPIAGGREKVYILTKPSVSCHSQSG